MESPLCTYFKAESVSEDLGLVIGYAIVCKENGLPYYDLQGDHICEDLMLKSVDDFMRNSRVIKDMHEGGAVGTAVHSFPLTSEIATALGIAPRKTGWLVAVKVDDPALLAKFKSGERTGFSIGGRMIRKEVARDG